MEVLQVCRNGGGDPGEFHGPPVTHWGSHPNTGSTDFSPQRAIPMPSNSPTRAPQTCTPPRLVRQGDKTTSQEATTRRSPTVGPHRLRETHGPVSCAHTQILPELKRSFLVSLKTWLGQCCRRAPPLESSGGLTSPQVHRTYQEQGSSPGAGAGLSQCSTYLWILKATAGFGV